MSDLAGLLRAKLDRAEEGEDWPHRRSCQMLQPVPAGFPFPTFSCNCDLPELWMRLIETQRKILGEHERLVAVNSSDRADLAERAALWRAVRLFAEAYGIEVEA